MLKSGRTDEKPEGHKFGILFQAATEDAPAEALIADDLPTDPPKWLDGVAAGWIETTARLGQLVNLDDGSIRDPLTDTDGG